jgi:tetratricopeptide (TPR) repeat protein
MHKQEASHQQGITGDCNVQNQGDENFIINAVNKYIYIVINIFSRKPQKPGPVGSVLNVLPISTRLERKELLKDIKNKYNQPTNTIPIVCIIGQGGAGKSTLATLWAEQFRQQNPKKVCWLINTASHRDNNKTKTPLESLQDGFREFADALYKEAQKDKDIAKQLSLDLAEIDQEKDMNKRMEKLIKFIQPRLKYYDKWLIVFDNVKDKDFYNQYLKSSGCLPRDSGVWGHGQVMITTRDDNMNDPDTSMKLVRIKELDRKEGQDLFFKIRKDFLEKEGKKDNNFSKQDPKEAEDFLSNIPNLLWFPLDIKFVAQRTCNQSYTDYLNELNNNLAEVHNRQKELQAVWGNDYNETRYAIIKEAAETAISTKELPEITTKGLLFLVSHISPTCIPKRLLDVDPKNHTADKFLSVLKSHSLITEESPPTVEESKKSFSIHDVTQEYLKEILKNLPQYKQDLPKIIQSGANNLVQFMEHISEKGSIKENKELIQHCECFRKEGLVKQCGDIVDHALRSVLAISYYKIGFDLNAKELLSNHCNNKIVDEKEAHISFYLAQSLQRLGNFIEAEREFKKVIDFYKRSGNITELVKAIIKQGRLYRVIGLYEDGKKTLTDAFEKIKLCPDALHKELFAEVHLALGIIDTCLGDYKNAEINIKDAGEFYKNSNQKLEYADVLVHYANVQEAQGRYTDAKQVLEESINLYKEVTGDDEYVDLRWVYTKLSDIECVLGNYHEAQYVLEKARKIYLKSSVHHLGSLSQIQANIKRKLGDHSQINDDANIAVKLEKEAYGENTLRHADVMRTCAQANIGLSCYEQAKTLLDTSLKIHEQQLSANHIKIGEVKAYLGYTYYKLGNLINAQKYLEEGQRIYEKHYGEDHFQTAGVLRFLGEMFLAKGNIQNAEKLMRKSLKILERNSQRARHPERYLTLESLSILFKQKAKNAKELLQKKDSIRYKQVALRYLVRAKDIITRTFPEDSTHINRIRGRLKELN